MDSDNVSSGDNQQETARSSDALDAGWVVGFVDGEDCFSVSVHRNPYIRKTAGWQLLPAFHVYQHRSHRQVLEDLSAYLGCGVIRSKGPHSSVLTMSVSGRATLSRRILPFFEEHTLRVKDNDFCAFASIVGAMARKEHFRPEGFERLAKIAYGMNAYGKQRARTLEVVLAGSSETVRRARLGTVTATDTTGKIQSDLHGDMQS